MLVVFDDIIFFLKIKINFVDIVFMKMLKQLNLEAVLISNCFQPENENLLFENFVIEIY